MAVPSRHLPQTPLDELRSWLGGHLEGDGPSQVRLLQLLSQLRQMALPELGMRLLKASSPPSLKRFILGLTARFDWPEWTPWLLQALQQEPDLGVFDEGCAALGRLELRSSLEALQKLAAQRTDPDRQLILRRELGSLEGQQPLSFYMGRLLEGEANVRLAHQGARGLAAVARPEDLGLLLEAMAGADGLAFRLLLRAATELPGGGAGPVLLDLFQDTLQTLVDLEALASLTQRVQAGARGAARTALAEALTDRMGRDHEAVLAALNQALATGEEGPALPPLEMLRDHAKGPYERFLTEALTVLLEGKVARFNAMVTEAQDTAAKEQAGLGVTLGLICDAMVRLFKDGDRKSVV